MSAVPSPAALDAPTGAKPGVRNLAIDSYRGLVMLLMMAEALELARVSAAFPGNPFWAFLAWNQTHVPYAGCSLHDTIQPGFSFLVGVALPYSIASRVARGESFRSMLGHALRRSLILIATGIFLRSQHSRITYFTFEDTLTQIGLGYTFLFLLGFASRRGRWAALAAILGGYWLSWALYPAPHWALNHNLGVAFDQWFLNLFPRESPFAFNSGGYLTLSFIPTLGTMLLGADRRRLAALGGAADSIPQATGGRHHRYLRGSCAALYRHLPGGEAHLDAFLDAIQRRPVLPLSFGLLLAHRGARLPALGVSAGGDRDELHRRLFDRGDVAWLCSKLAPHPSRPALLRVSGRGRGAAGTRHGGAGAVLAGAVLDVPAQDLPQDLSFGRTVIVANAGRSRHRQEVVARNTSL
jgi:hypothetical protein